MNAPQPAFDGLLGYVADGELPLSSERAAVIAAAVGPVMRIGLQDAELAGAGGRQRIEEWIKWISETAAGLPLPALPAGVPSRQSDAAE